MDKKGQFVPKKRSFWMKGTNKHTKRKLYVLALTDAFLNYKRINECNVCKHTVKIAPSLLCVHINLFLTSNYFYPL